MQSPPGKSTPILSTRDLRLVVVAVVLMAASGLTYFTHAGKIAPFLISAAALGTLAALVGRSVDRLGDRLG